MAKINRLSGMVRGRIGDEVFYSRHGEQMVMKAPCKRRLKNTRRWIGIKTVFGEVSSMWRELPEEIKVLWETYAKSLGSPSDVEKNDNVSYRLCPISNFPPKPRNIRGVQAFISANCKGYYAGMRIPLLYPPLDMPTPPPPEINCVYDHKSGELVVQLRMPKITVAGNKKICKAFIWITALMTRRGRNLSIVQKHLLDTFDAPTTANNLIERRYAGIKDTGKHYNYRALLFKDLPYLRIYIGAQLLVSPDSQTAPVVSSGSYIPYWILNEPRYIELEDLLLAGELKRPTKNASEN